MQGGERYNSISNFLKAEFGQKTVKLSIDAGFTCPNRDGLAGLGGCAFCSEGGSGELAAHATSDEEGIRSSITEQISTLSAKWPGACYLAYFQSFTNTYAPVEKLRRIYYSALDDPRINGIAIATRPDCLGEDVLDLLEEINNNHFMWVELGLQSAHNRTLRAMNTCCTVECYEKAVSELLRRGIRVVTHLILGLPGETEEMILESVRRVCTKDIFGLKLHLMNIVKTSPLYREMPDYTPFESIEEYVDLVVRCLEIIPPGVTIHRLTGDVPRKILVSPEWSYKKRTILNAINRELAIRGISQGSGLKENGSLKFNYL